MYKNNFLPASVGVTLGKIAVQTISGILAGISLLIINDKMKDKKKEPPIGGGDEPARPPSPTTPPPEEPRDDPDVIETFMPRIQGDIQRKILERAQTDVRFQDIFKRYERVFSDPNFRTDDPFNREGQAALHELKGLTEEVVGEELPSIITGYGLKTPVYTPFSQLFNPDLSQRRIKKFY